MAIDASIPLGVRPMQIEPQSNALMRFLQMQGTMQQNALAQLQMQDFVQRRKMAEEQMAQAREAEQARGSWLDGMNPNAGPARPFSPVEALRFMKPDDVAKMQELFNPRRKVARTVEIKGPDGKPYTVQLDEEGRPVGENLPKWVAPHFAGLGDRVEAIDPTAVRPGQQFKMGMAPGEAERIGIARTAAGAAQRQAGAAEEANRISREQQQQLRGLQIGKEQDEARVRDQRRQSDIATMEESVRLIDKALAHPGLPIATGVQGVVDPRNYAPGSDAVNFQVLMDQIGGRAFLQAFETLKGGGQITEVEGRKATDAIARMNRKQGTPEFKTALQDFRNVIAGAYKRNTGKDMPKAGDGEWGIVR